MANRHSRMEPVHRARGSRTSESAKLIGILSRQQKSASILVREDSPREASCDDRPRASGSLGEIFGCARASDWTNGLKMSP